jgi:hypothetical protein
MKGFIKPKKGEIKGLRDLRGPIKKNGGKIHNWGSIQEMIKEEKEITHS